MALLAALPLWSCSSAPSTDGTGESVGGVDAQSASGTESSGAQSASGNGTIGRPGGIGRLGGQTGGEAGIRCNADVELQPLGFETVSPLGYSAAEIMSALGPSYAATLTYADDSATPLTLQLVSGGQAAYAAGCSRIAIDVSVIWSTADGAFDEALRGRLFALSPDVATLDVEVPASEFVGNYARRHAAELEPPPLRFSFQLEFSPSEAHGSVSALRGPPDSQDSLGIGSF